MMKITSMILMIKVVKIVIVRLNTEKVLLLWTAWSNSQNSQGHVWRSVRLRVKPHPHAFSSMCFQAYPMVLIQQVFFPNKPFRCSKSAQVLARANRPRSAGARRSQVRVRRKSEARDHVVQVTQPGNADRIGGFPRDSRTCKLAYWRIYLQSRVGAWKRCF